MQPKNFLTFLNLKSYILNSLSLSLLVLRVCAYNTEPSLPADHFTFRAYFFYRCPNLHKKNVESRGILSSDFLHPPHDSPLPPVRVKLYDYFVADKYLYAVHPHLPGKVGE